MHFARSPSIEYHTDISVKFSLMSSECPVKAVIVCEAVGIMDFINNAEELQRTTRRFTTIGKNCTPGTDTSERLFSLSGQSNSARGA